MPEGDYFDLGSYAREVTTSSAEARTWFDRGLVWTYAFNHEEARGCFERAIEHDPGCALAHWGLAYALGPNYNKPWEDFDPADLASSVSRAFGAVTAGRPAHIRGHARRARARRARWARAIPSAEPAADCSAWSRGYADAMREVYAGAPRRPDVAALFADALMNLTPWALWDQATGQPGRCAARGRGQGGARAGAGGTAGAASRRPALLHPPDGDVGPARGRAAGRRPAARPGPGRGPPACTCRRTSTCCAATTGGWCPATPPRSRSTRSSARGPAR